MSAARKRQPPLTPEAKRLRRRESAQVAPALRGLQLAPDAGNVDAVEPWRADLRRRMDALADARPDAAEDAWRLFDALTERPASLPPRCAVHLADAWWPAGPSETWRTVAECLTRAADVAETYAARLTVRTRV